MAEKITIEQMVEVLGSMTAMQLNEFSKAIQEKFGVSAMPTMSAGPAAAGEAAAASTDFDVEITAVGDSKMGVVKFVKDFAGKSLKEASDYVNDDKRPSIGTLMGKVFKESEADELLAKLKDAGAVAKKVSK